MSETLHSLSQLSLPATAGERAALGGVRGSALPMLIAEAASRHTGLLLVITPDVQKAHQLELETRFFLGNPRIPVQTFPDRETLPYDVFSPLPELISQRLTILHGLQQQKRGVLVVPAGTLMHRLCPPAFVHGHSLLISEGETLDLDAMRSSLEQAGYRYVSQVLEHGEFTVRGSLLDLFPMGSNLPYRIDLFDDEIDSIRTFDPETQRTIEKVERISMLPGREFPTDEKAIRAFRQNYRASIEHDPNVSIIYQEVSDGRFPGGIEYYLPLFFEQTATLFDYLPDNTLVMAPADISEATAHFDEMAGDRYEMRAHDRERPILPPRLLFMDSDEVSAAMKRHAGLLWQPMKIDERRKGIATFANLEARNLPPLALNARATRPAGLLEDFLAGFAGRTLFTAESAGRREHLVEMLAGFS
ncbi:MAG: transcription-repair coupling factor, partial [Sedimenticolaceae bacterium]|nr:transcription-repair coupling factor [Sedimenticolaceae bacterium]